MLKNALKPLKMQKISTTILSKSSCWFGLSDKTWTCGLYHPKVARYQLRHPQILTFYCRKSGCFSKRLVYYITHLSKSQEVFKILSNIFLLSFYRVKSGLVEFINLVLFFNKNNCILRFVCCKLQIIIYILY